ncbi:ral-GDS-related protein-like [Diceros bicornis minor]|uniref:ral-GDS-related protein-like n=1 Tax=Diceros bicornis minor TaxID=77932 RepID=UPI0026EB5C7C|nr:ral-GDS-related protein-like [Diceros bicornis minor]
MRRALLSRSWGSTPTFLQVQLEHPRPIGGDLEVPPGPESPPTSAPAPVPAPELESAEQLAPGRILTPPGEITAEPDPAPEPACPWDVTSKNLLREEKPDFLEFPPRLVAEQLTLMDVDLFKKVMPHDFLDSIWSQCDNRGNEHLAPTIDANMTHFNRMVEYVVTTCIGDPSMTVRDRARVVEL